MANLLKKQVARILEKDVTDEEFDHFMIILDQNTDWDTKQDVSTAEVSQNIQNFFLSNVQGILDQYSPLYQEFKEVIFIPNLFEVIFLSFLSLGIEKKFYLDYIASVSTDFFFYLVMTLIG